jgi:flagellar basal-body rod protein FlgG
MIRGFYTALSGIIAAMNRQAVVADNLANVNTTGFHQSRTSSADFGLELGMSLGGSINHLGTVYPIGRLGTGNLAVGLTLDRRQGPFQQTGVLTDLAIEGDGLFVVRTPDGIAYTRSGDFAISADGTLTTQQGFPVLDVAGRSIVTDGAPVIGPDGSVQGTGQRLAVVGWPQGEPVRIGQNLLLASGPLGPAGGTVRQGTLEASNVDTAGAMTEMMTLQRHFALSSRALSIQDETLGDAAQIGRLR